MTRRLLTEAELDVVRQQFCLDQYAPAPPQPQPQPAPSLASPSLLGSLDDFLVLQDISCVDADGTVFEQYPELHVRKDIVRDGKRRRRNFASYSAAVHCEQNGLFLPSFALTCNILAALYHPKTNPDVKALLHQYKDKRYGTGWHAQNTVINYGTQEIIHYPSARDFGRKGKINALHPRIAKSFTKAMLQDCLLEDALKDPAHTRYVRQLTGLTDPSVLVEIGQYFGQPAKLWFPWNGQAGANFQETRSALFGRGDSYLYHFYLYLFGNGDLIGGSVSRGVR